MQAKEVPAQAVHWTEGIQDHKKYDKIHSKLAAHSHFIGWLTWLLCAGKGGASAGSTVGGRIPGTRRHSALGCSLGPAAAGVLS